MPALSVERQRHRLRNATLSSAASLGLLLTGFVSPAYAELESQASPPAECSTLLDFEFDSTTITSAETVPSGALSHRGDPVGEHCLVTGHMNDRVSETDDQQYGIGFEMRLPNDWSEQYLYQGNGGLDGAVATALGTAGGSDSALQMGMAVISSDAGHDSSQNPGFGIDPQARLDYGYQAVDTLTPMAKALIETAYGTAPEYSYMAGSSNGGRHTMVGASRYTDEYDGFLAVAPGFNLPQAALAQLWGAQQWDTVSTDQDLDSALTQDERELVADAILEQCDELDGIADGMVFDSAACQETFDITQHVPTCESERNGSCLTEDQQHVISDIFNGATTTDGTAIYAPFPYDPGLTSADWGSWKFDAPISRDSVAIGYIFSSPPYAPELNSLRDFVLDLDVDEANESIYAASGEYTESAMEFMTPPDLTYQDLKANGGKMLVIHGASDGVFSMADTSAWYQELNEAHGGDASDFVQYYEVPGMAHTRGGPATDQHDSLAALINWVEKGEQPGALNAWVSSSNESVPESWSADRSRPLCAYPNTAFYTEGDPEVASSFECRAPEDIVQLDPQVTIDPNDVTAGETVTLTGTGYTPDATVTAGVTDENDGQLAKLEEISTDTDGAFSTTWKVPAATPAGQLTLTFTDDTDPSASASAALTVTETASEPSPSTTPESPAPTETAPSDTPPPTQPESSAPSPTVDTSKQAQNDDLATTGAAGIATLIAAAVLLLFLGTAALLYVRKRRAQRQH